MNLNTHISLSFNGQCETAFKFYERCFGGTIAFMLRWGESPAAGDAPTEWRDKILHATLMIGETRLSGGDVLPGVYEPPRGFSIVLGVEDPAETERLFKVLAENGTIRTPLQKTFWSLRYGAVTDRFSIPWELNCQQSE